ncbi:hypothetical protein D5086_010500 [Populus alba]|uniref:Uncharacterized protein n=3 Tax=Populus TaxID=3689 RepID=A0ACC4CA64_POPAL|nr:hypothetical protein NC653_013519 [Populus alba x Populus x berolinensis]TKS00337.1 hypothetical protein D5086_0000185500 [Populus alba]
MSGAIEMIAAPVMPSPETNAPQVLCIVINPVQLYLGHGALACVLNRQKLGLETIGFSSTSQDNSPSLSGSPEEPKLQKSPRTPLASLSPRFITALGSPVRKALRLTKFDPQDAWLPLTESRNGNKY